jgi:uncharacterized protein (TIGR03435 family)
MLRLILCTALAAGMSRAQAPRFEAAAIHPASPAESNGPSGCTTTQDFMRCTNVTLKRSIAGAYNVGQDRVLGGPDWADTDRFDIVARSEQPVGDKGLTAMFQSMLADRFKLALHRETRNAEAMVLEVSRNGPKIQPAESDARGSWSNMHDHVQATKITMGDFAEILSRDLRLPVVDGTGLAGAYSFTLRWDPAVADDGLNRHEELAALRAEMSAAIARELGLTLRSRKVPVEMIVIDQAEKPSDND